MKSSLKNIVAGILSVFLFPKNVLAQGVAWGGRCIAQTDVATIQGLECLFANALKVVVSLAGIIFFVTFLNGGFQYLFSQGDPKKASAASSTLTMAILGLVGVVASYLILKLIQTFTGANVTDFKIPG